MSRSDERENIHDRSRHGKLTKGVNQQTHSSMSEIVLPNVTGHGHLVVL